MRAAATCLIALSFAIVTACASGPKATPDAAPDAGAEAPPPELPAELADVKTDFGVDLHSRIVTIGALNDDTGPAVVIGRPWGAGKRILARQINAAAAAGGDSGILPKGWRFDLVEKNHQYDPAKATAGYDDIVGEVLFIATSLGSSTTMPLRERLKRDGVVAFPASLSGEMASFEHTPPLGPSYGAEAKRAMDFVARTPEAKPAIIYQDDDYGRDALASWQDQAAHHKLTVVGERAVKPGQVDHAADVKALKDAGATHILLAVLPASTGSVLQAALASEWTPVFLGCTPSWSDGYFREEALPPAAFSTYYWVTSVPYWGEDVPGMKGFVAAWEKWGKDLSPPDFYILASYIQGLVQLEGVKRALAAKDLTRAGYFRAMRTISAFDAGGLIQPVDLTAFPYVTATKTRVLKPDFAAKSWTVAGGWAAPESSQPQASGSTTSSNQ